MLSYVQSPIETKKSQTKTQDLEEDTFDNIHNEKRELKNKWSIYNNKWFFLDDWRKRAKMNKFSLSN